MKTRKNLILLVSLIWISIILSSCNEEKVDNVLLLNADFSYLQENNLDITFTSNSTGNIISYNWKFGDTNDPNAEGEGKTTSHSYTAFGNYEVTLTISDGQETKIKTKEITLAPSPEFILVRKWIIDKAYGNGNPDPNTAGKQIQFFKNNTYTFETINGTWEFNNDKNIIIMDKGTSLESDWTIKELSPTSFIASFISSFDGSKLEWQMIPK